MRPKPYAIRYTSFGESMGYDSQSAVFDADGRHVVTFGNGTADQRAEAEAHTLVFVDAINTTP